MSTEPLTRDDFLTREDFYDHVDGILRLVNKIAQRQEENARQQEETDRRMKETDRRMKETDRKMKETDRRIGRLTSRIGEIVENMIGGNIVAQFRDYGYNVTEISRNIEFGSEETDTVGEIDVLLDDGSVAILIEVKTKPSTDDILNHAEQMENYRRWKDSKGEGKKRYVGAVAGAVIEDNVVKFAQRKGFYVIVQSGYAVEILAPPEGFKAKEW